MEFSKLGMHKDDTLAKKVVGNNMVSTGSRRAHSAKPRTKSPVLIETTLHYPEDSANSSDFIPLQQPRPKPPSVAGTEVGSETGSKGGRGSQRSSRSGKSSVHKDSASQMLTVFKGWQRDGEPEEFRPQDYLYENSERAQREIEEKMAKAGDSWS